MSRIEEAKKEKKEKKYEEKNRNQRLRVSTTVRTPHSVVIEKLFLLRASRSTRVKVILFAIVVVFANNVVK